MKLIFPLSTRRWARHDTLGILVHLLVTLDIPKYCDMSFLFLVFMYISHIQLQVCICICKYISHLYVATLLISPLLLRTEILCDWSLVVNYHAASIAAVIQRTCRNPPWEFRKIHSDVTQTEYICTHTHIYIYNVCVWVRVCSGKENTEISSTHDRWTN